MNSLTVRDNEQDCLNFIQSILKSADIFVMGGQMTKPQSKLLKLGKRIANWRSRRMMTVEALANKAGISKGNLSDIENGKKDPRYLTLAFIAEALGITVATLLREL